MSKVFTCACGRRTTEPFIVRGVPLCAICADEIAPQMVSARERANRHQYSQGSFRAKGWTRADDR